MTHQHTWVSLEISEIPACVRNDPDVEIDNAADENGVIGGILISESGLSDSEGDWVCIHEAFICTECSCVHLQSASGDYGIIIEKPTLLEECTYTITQICTLLGVNRQRALVIAKKQGWRFGVPFGNAKRFDKYQVDEFAADRKELVCLCGAKMRTEAHSQDCPWPYSGNKVDKIRLWRYDQETLNNKEDEEDGITKR